MTQSSKVYQLVYITKITIGLMLIGVAVVATLLKNPGAQVTYAAQGWLTAYSIAVFVLIFPLARVIYSGMDELQKKLHHNACVTSLMILIPLAGIAGILQSNAILPIFNQVWFLVAGIAVWGFALMLSDRAFK